MKNDLIKQYEKIVGHTLDYFIVKYFGKLEDVDYYWIGNHIGGCCHINDYFFSVEEMLDYMRNSATQKQMFDHYDYALNEEEQDRTPLTFKHYKMNFKK